MNEQVVSGVTLEPVLAKTAVKLIVALTIEKTVVVFPSV